MTPESLTIRRPDDWHVHLRDGDMLRGVVAHTARQFARAIVMPNLSPPVTDTAAARAYRERIVAALLPGSDFTPLMTCYLTDTTDADDLVHGFAEGVFTAAKLYPAHATTNSAHGVSDVAALAPVLEAMQRAGMPLLVHGEVTDPAVDVFDREAVFIERVLAGLVRDFPALKVVFEHITTAEAVAMHYRAQGASTYPQGPLGGDAGTAGRPGGEPGAWLDGWVVDSADARSVPRLEAAGIHSEAIPLWMTDDAATAKIAASVLALALRAVS